MNTLSRSIVLILSYSAQSVSYQSLNIPLDIQQVISETRLSNHHSSDDHFILTHFVAAY